MKNIEYLIEILSKKLAEASKNNEQRHLAELDKVKREHLSWCENGIDKYLS